VKLCRFDDDRLGVVEGDHVLDVTSALEQIALQRWPIRPGDPLIRSMDRVLPAVAALRASAPRKPASAVVYKSPVANPGKIVAAPINYIEHIEESKKDPGIAQGRTNIRHISDWGLFLKASSSLIGFGEEIRLRLPDRRNDHEVELAVVIGRQGDRIRASDALDHVFGYTIGLDMTVRGPELQCFRKSLDTYSVLGPWIVTRDEIPDPNNLDLSIRVNGQMRQNSNTKNLVYNVQRLIEYASSMYTLYPGDVIMTGTPSGVGPVKLGDVLTAEIQSIGRCDVRVAAEYAG
jgi:2-keto-4-pentenoate hydratase/2-oxohepta-3-ene-1,7-dioic acid hydratase in catechol pathway